MSGSIAWVVSFGGTNTDYGRYDAVDVTDGDTVYFTAVSSSAFIHHLRLHDLHDHQPHARWHIR